MYDQQRKQFQLSIPRIIQQTYLKMQLIFPSSESSNSPQRASTYTVISLDGKNYRVLTREHKSYLEMSRISAVFWYLFGASLLGSALVLFFSLKVLIRFTKLPFIVVVCFCSHLLFTIYVYKKKKHFTSSSVYFSSINLLVWMVPVAVLGFLQIKQILIPLCFYSTFLFIKVLIETFLSIKYMSNKSQMVAKFLIMMEAMMIALKVDEKIQSPWRDVLFSHVVFFLFLTLCILFMTAYLIYMKYIQNEQNLMKYKFTGALFIYFDTLAFCLLSAAPLLYIFLQIPIWIICSSMSVALFCNATFNYVYRKDIVIFFCTLNEIKSFNQIISFQPIESVKPQFINHGQVDNTQPMYLYRISENWLTLNPEKATQFQEQNPEINKDDQQSSQKSTKMTDCTICLDKPAEVVWMPCGHLTVCMECCSFMFEKRNMNCVLCKITPEQIYIIDTNEQGEKLFLNEIEKCNDEKIKSLDVSIDNNDVSVISGCVMLECEKQPESRKELISPKKKKIKTKHTHHMKNNKIAFTVLEGYNVKII